jgi:O-antigen/teichoic acid export membrane protein
MSLLRQSVRALQWSVLGELGARLLGPVTFVVLARVLLPEDFGVVAAATVVTSFAQVVCEAGLAKALVQRAQPHPAAASVAFWINTGLGAVLMLLLLAGAPAVAQFFGDARIAPALRALSPVLLMAALAAVPAALLQRELRFQPLFWARLAGAGLPALAGIPVALAGGGWWALVAGTLAGQAAQTLVTWRGAGWTPAGGFDRHVAAELLRFGRWALLAALFGWGYGWLDAVVVGRFLGSHEMGLYRTGSTLVTLVFGVLFTPLLPVLYSLFSKAQHDLPLLRESLLTVVRAVSLVALPVALALYVLREPLVLAVLGERWREATAVVGLIALMQGGTWLVAFNGEMYRAVGRPQAEAWVMGPMLVVYVAVYVVAVQGGLAAFLWSRVGLAVLGIAVHVLAARLVLRIPLRAWVRPFGSLVLAVAAVLWLSPWTAPLAVLALWRLEWPLVQRLRQRVKRSPPAPVEAR